MKKSNILMYITILLISIFAASYLYYEKIIIPERISKARVSAINNITIAASKEIDAFMLKTTDDGVTFGEIFKSADSTIENIDKNVSQLLLYTKEEGGNQLTDALEYVRGCRAIARHTKSFFHRSMLRRTEEEHIEKAIEKMKSTRNTYEFESLKKNAEQGIKDLKKQTSEQLDAARSIAEQCKWLIDIGTRGNIAEYALISADALNQGIALAQSVLPKEEAESPSAGNERGIAGVIGDAGYPCHEALSVKNTAGSTYTVECAERPGEKTRAKYSVNVRTGTVTKN